MAQRLSEVISLLDGGLTDEAAGERFGEILRACERTQGDGSFTITIKVKANGQGAFLLTDDLKDKCPRGRGDDLFYLSQGRLSRRHPGQMTIDMVQGDQEGGQGGG